MTTEPEKLPEVTPDPPEPDKTGIVQTIREEIASALGKLFDTGRADVKDGADKPGGDPAPGKDRSDVTAAVKAEIAKLKDAEAKANADRSLAERVHELEEKLKKAAENPPEEFRKVTEWMWR